jgi:leucyl aminopeptidase
VYRGATTDPSGFETEVLFVPVFGATDDLSDVDWLDRASRQEISRARDAKVFRARPFETFTTILIGDHCRARRVTLVGAGPIEEQQPERWRRLGGTAGYAARTAALASCAFLIRRTADAVAAAQHVADGFTAAEFDGRTYKTMEPVERAPADLTVLAPGGDAAALDAAVARGRVIGECANFARVLCNEPANVLTPSVFAERVRDAASKAGLGVDVLDEDRIRSLNMRLLMAVAQGSAEPPRVIVLKHEPPGAADSPVIALVGKGVTFDTGGVSIKPADGMERMKDDMSGGASVAAAMLALARLGCRHRVIAVIPTTENMVGGRASRPGDVVQGASGKTVEIINTDAEGRLILADALWYAGQLGATHLVDIATLTGACVVALGRHVSGLMGQPDAWVHTVHDAGKVSGDRLWWLPLYEEARDQIKSDIADIINSAGRPGATITAAAFLREFVGNMPWAHLDIAGTAWAETKEPYQPKGATASGMRTLIELGMSGGAPRRESKG